MYVWLVLFLSATWALDESNSVGTLGNWFTLDVIGKFGFGRSFNLLEKPDNRFISDVIDGHLFRVNILVHFPSLINTGIDMILYPKGLRRGRKFLQVCREYVERTFQEKYHKQDLISHVLNANGKSSLTPAEMWEESKFIVAAGMYHPVLDSLKVSINLLVGIRRVRNIGRGTSIRLLLPCT